MVTTRRGTEVGETPVPPKKVMKKTPVSPAAPKPTPASTEDVEFSWSVILFMVATLVVFVTYLGVLFYTLPQLEVHNARTHRALTFARTTVGKICTVFPFPATFRSCIRYRLVCHTQSNTQVR